MGLTTDTSARMALPRGRSIAPWWAAITQNKIWRRPWLWGSGAIAVIAVLLATPLGRLHSVNATVAASAFLCGGLISWLCTPMCARRGQRYLLNGMRLNGTLTALAGIALFNGQAMALGRSSYIVTMLISNVGGLLCLHIWEEQAQPRTLRLFGRSTLQLWRLAFAINCVGLVAAPLWLAAVINNQDAFLAARIGPIALGVFSAIMLAIQSLRSQQIEFPMQVALLGLAAQTFFIVSAPPFSLNWAIACALVMAQLVLVYRGQMRQMFATLPGASSPMNARFHVAPTATAPLLTDPLDIQTAPESAEASAPVTASAPSWLSMVAHDLKIPLNMLTLLSSQIAYIIEKKGSTEQIGEYARRMQSSSHRFERFMNLFLDFTGKQIDAPMRLKLERMSLLALVRQVIDDEQAVIANPLTLTLAPPAGEPGFAMQESLEVTWDKERIEAVLLNLLTNAVKFSQYGAPVAVNLWRPNAELICIAIRDQGKGMTPEAEAHMFDPYYRSPDSTAVQGHGLGLAMVKTIVEWHQGDIAVATQLDVGTYIQITLPMTLSDEAIATS